MPIPVAVKTGLPEPLTDEPAPAILAERTDEGLDLTFDRIATCGRYTHTVIATKTALWLTVQIIDEPSPAAVSGSFRCHGEPSTRLRVVADVGNDVQHVRLLDREGALVVEVHVPPADAG